MTRDDIKKALLKLCILKHTLDEFERQSNTPVTDEELAALERIRQQFKEANGVKENENQ